MRKSIVRFSPVPFGRGPFLLFIIQKFSLMSPPQRGKRVGKRKIFFVPTRFFPKKGWENAKKGVGLRFSTERRGRENEKTGFFAKSGFFGVPERIRTADLPLRRRTLYPAELRKQGRVGRACFVRAPVRKTSRSRAHGCRISAPARGSSPSPPRLFILTHPRPFCKRIFVFLRHFI